MANVIDKIVGLVVGPQGPKGDTGQTGSQGATGATGVTPNLTIGTVTTLETGSQATATITGTAENPVLSLGIPRGATGVKGEKGENGDVASVNGKTGAVVLDAADVGAIATPSSPTSGDVLAYDGTAWVAQKNSGDNDFFVVEVTTDWWTEGHPTTANCTWDELNATTKPILWNEQIAQKFNDMSGGRIAYIAPSMLTGMTVPSMYTVKELVFESSTGYTVTENTYTIDTDIYQATKNIAPLYSEYLTYNVGDLVIYNNTLYQCTTAVSAPESFNFVKWTSTTIANVIASL